MRNLFIEVFKQCVYAYVYTYTLLTYMQMCFYLNKPLLFNKNSTNIIKLIVILFKSGSLLVIYNPGNIIPE